MRQGQCVKHLLNNCNVNNSDQRLLCVTAMKYQPFLMTLQKTGRLLTIRLLPVTARHRKGPPSQRSAIAKKWSRAIRVTRWLLWHPHCIKFNFGPRWGSLRRSPRHPTRLGREPPPHSVPPLHSLPHSLTFSSKSCVCTYTHTYISSYRTLLRWEQEAIVFSYTSPWGPFFRPFAMAALCDGGPLR